MQKYSVGQNVVDFWSEYVVVRSDSDGYEIVDKHRACPPERVTHDDAEVRFKEGDDGNASDA